MNDAGARLERARLNPAAVFRSPGQVEHDPTLSREDKLAILASWEEDARELAVAEEENMAGGEPSRLAEVAAARTRVEDGSASPAMPHVRHFVRPVRETIHADHEIDEAALRLSLQDHPILPVNDGDEIIGVLGQADLARIRDTARSERVTARDAMTAELDFCYLDDAVKIAHALMDRHRCDHLLVVDPERTLVGIVGRDDLPPVSEAEVQSLQDHPDVLDSREENTPGIASTGGLEVYAERPIIKKTPTS